MADFDPNLAFRTGLLNNSGGGTTGGDGLANVVESPEILVKGADKIAGITAKLVGSAAPIPINFGEVSMFAGLEVAQGAAWSEQKINRAAEGFSRGGALYNILAPLLKDGTIKDLTAGAGGATMLDSPGFIGAAQQFDDIVSHPMNIGGSGNFAALGDLPPPLPMEAMAISAPNRGSAGPEI